jgi:hypothetical protein
MMLFDPSHSLIRIPLPVPVSHTAVFAAPDVGSDNRHPPATRATDFPLN